MKEYFFVLLGLILLSIGYLKIAKKYNIVDKPNHRSSHTKPTIRGGGVLFYFAIVLYFIVSNFANPYFFIGLSLIAIISYVDDLVTLSSKFRLFFQFIAIAVTTYQVFLITNIQIEYYFLPAIIIIGVGFINIYNFMDGINGLTAIYSLVCFIGIYLINMNEAIIDPKILIYIMLSIGVFGYYNFRKKALFFAGDIGSITIAVILFFFLLLFTVKLESPLIILLVLIYGVDAVLTIAYRKYIKENIMDAHRHHIYQKMTDRLKLSHIKISLLYAVNQLIIVFIVYKTYQLDLKIQFILFFSIIAIYIAIYILVFKLLEKKTIK